MATATKIAVPTGTWNVDPAHSSVEFTVTDVQDLMATIRGRFREFEGTLETEEDLVNAHARGVIRAASITTDQEQRDQHLRSPDFLDVERYPDITFESTRFDLLGDDRLLIEGVFTL